MKKFYSLLAATLCAASLFSQAPQKMSYQAVIRNSSNELVTEQTVGMQISILQGTTEGTAVYTETHTAETNSNGLVTLEIGTGTTTDNFSTIDWSAGPYFIKTETAVVPPLTTYTITGTSEILSVPFALYANKSLTSHGAVTVWYDQEIADHKTFTGTVTVPEPVNSTDAATKAYVDALLARIEALELSDFLEKGFTDSRDGNHYAVVKIGNQIWMAENLAYLPLVQSNSEFQTQGNNLQPGYGVYGYDGSDVVIAKSQANYATYGVLYNWWAAMAGAGSSSSNPSGVQGICPAGWHLPSDAEWIELTDYLGGASVSGGKLKETGTTHWLTPNTGATDEEGFKALPGGCRYIDGEFYGIGENAYWWCSTEVSATHSWSWYVNYNNSYANNTDYFKKDGFSVRCVQD